MPEPRDPGPAAPSAGGVERPILLVGNPTSRSGKAAERIAQASELMQHHGLAHELRATMPGGGTVELVSRAIIEEGFRRIVYLGGDGTFNEVAKGICRSGKAGEVVLGMLPAGTANDQGKSFGISATDKALEENIATIAAGRTTRLDVGEVTALSAEGVVLARDLFFDSMGWGLSAAILAFRNRELEIVKKMPIWREMYRDHAVYIRAAVRELALSWLTRDRFTADLEIDGELITLDRLSDLVISNTILYAGEWIIAPQARHDDGMFEVGPFRGTRDWTSKVIVQHKKVPLTEEMLNRIGVSHSPTYRGTNIKLQLLRPTTDKRLPAQIDGDEFPPADHVEIRVIPRMLALIVPEDFHWI